ncbi:sulfate transporter [Trifolium medium]|uniref:Sulfate transporter n=1 Tax=Trifolium medium TaxID=97028 RepID=A0A392NR24_9FABA|nr:sulfate transporter [Trifolium medium]
MTGEKVHDVGGSSEQGNPSTKLVHKYRSNANDVKWARQGVVATVKYGEAIPVVQAQIADAGFQNLHIIPLGADKVFIHSLSAEDVMINFNGARPFFDHFFSSIVRWDKELLPIQRVAWVRLYGTSLHAWSVDFFKLCVLDCGRYLRTDEFSLEKDRFDYVRVLESKSKHVVDRDDHELGNHVDMLVEKIAADLVCVMRES